MFPYRLAVLLAPGLQHEGCVPSFFAGAEGVRMKEGASINKSLLTLGTVINKLSEGVAVQGEQGAVSHGQKPWVL